jgi:hypothetical protein
MYHHPRDTFGLLAHLKHRDQIRREHAVALDAYRRAHGVPPWLKRTTTTPQWPTVSEINAAIDWWNDWQEHGG